MEYLLFKQNRELKTSENVIRCNVNLHIEEFTLHFWNLYSAIEPKHNYRTSLFRLYISILTLGKTKVYYGLNSNNNILHMAYLITSNYKYPFLEKKEACIGPCDTDPKARGKGIYPFMINHIVNKNNDLTCYLFVRKDNKSSIRGVEKAGFEISKKRIRDTKIFHRFVYAK